MLLVVEEELCTGLYSLINFCQINSAKDSSEAALGELT